MVPVVRCWGDARQKFRALLGYCRVRTGNSCISGVYAFSISNGASPRPEDIIPPVRVTRTLPIGMEDLPSRVQRTFARETDYSFSKGGFLRLEGPHVFTRPYAVILKDGRLLKESSVQINRSIYQHPTIWRRRLETEVEISNAWTVCSHATNNYYHWLFDTLPLLVLPNCKERIRRESPTLILPRPQGAFQKDSLDLLGFSRCAAVNVSDQFRVIRADTLNVPILPQATDQAHPEIVAALRREFLPHASPSSGKRRIYITRLGEKRCVTNEPEISHLFEKYDIAVVRLPSLSFQQQIELFANTELVIAPHGAGVANCVFLPEGASVIELFSTTYVNPMYWRLANSCRCNYAILLGTPHRTFEPGSDGYKIDPRKLEKLIERVIAIPAGRPRP